MTRTISLREPSKGEFAADGVVHAVGIVAAVAGVIVLIAMIAVRSGLVELVTAWLWSERAGVISHQTALALHGLSDALPAHVHLTLPSAWRRRRFRVPADVVLHYADVPPKDRTWFGAVPTTNPRRSLNDCACEGLSPELLRRAAQQALRRGLVAKADLIGVEEALEPFGGFAA